MMNTVKYTCKKKESSLFYGLFLECMLEIFGILLLSNTLFNDIY